MSLFSAFQINVAVERLDGLSMGGKTVADHCEAFTDWLESRGLGCCWGWWGVPGMYETKSKKKGGV